jgi:hypothetical protein
MLIRRIGVALLATTIATSAFALNTKELLSAIAMPLAVAAASDLNGVNEPDLIDLVTQLNQANVPPTEFVQIVRYVPVALIDQSGQPQIVQYVTTETRRGITGTTLATNIADELRMRYDVPRFELAPAQPVIVETTEIIPQYVTTRMNSSLLSLVAMPVAVAAVADLAGIPQQQLIDVVAQLNQANVPPPQFIEVVRYVPVALVNTDTSPQFVQYVTTQVNNGVTGPALATVVADRLRTFGAREINVVAPQPQPVFVPQPQPAPVQIVRTHPHGGPPGQLKKVYGLQTGAEVVHREAPKGHGRGHQKRVVVVPQPMISSSPQPVPVQVKPGKGHGGGNPHGGPPGQNKGQGHGNGKGHGKGKG